MQTLCTSPTTWSLRSKKNHLRRRPPAALLPLWSKCSKPVHNHFLKNLYWTRSQLVTYCSLHSMMRGSLWAQGKRRKMQRFKWGLEFSWFFFEKSCSSVSIFSQPFLNWTKHKQILKARNTQTSKLEPTNWQDRVCRIELGLNFPPKNWSCHRGGDWCSQRRS